MSDHDEFTPIPLAEVPIGWEPIAQYADHDPLFQKHLQDHIAAGRRPLVARTRCGNLSIWLHSDALIDQPPPTT